MNKPTRDTPAGRAYQDIRNLARRDGRDVAEYLTRYALEGFLARLVASPHAEDFVRTTWTRSSCGSLESSGPVPATG